MNVLAAAGDPTDYVGMLTPDLGPIALGIAGVATLGLGVFVVKWGLPQALGFFKRIANKG